MVSPWNLSLSLCEAHDTRGLKALPLNLPPASTIYGDAGYTDYQAEDEISETEQVSLEIMRKKNSLRSDEPYIAYIKQHLRHPIETLFSHDSRVPLRLTATRGRSSNYATLSQIYSCCNNGWLLDENSCVYYCSYFGICFHRLGYSSFMTSIKQFLTCSISHVYFFYHFLYFVTSNLD